MPNKLIRRSLPKSEFPTSHSNFMDKRLEEIETVLETLPDPQRGIRYIMDRLSKRFPVINIDDDNVLEAPKPIPGYDDEIERLYHPENFSRHENNKNL